jgi:hypothetical protein
VFVTFLRRAGRQKKAERQIQIEVYKPQGRLGHQIIQEGNRQAKLKDKGNWTASQNLTISIFSLKAPSIPIYSE